MSHRHLPNVQTCSKLHIPHAISYVGSLSGFGTSALKYRDNSSQGPWQLPALHCNVLLNKQQLSQPIGQMGLDVTLRTDDHNRFSLPASFSLVFLAPALEAFATLGSVFSVALSLGSFNLPLTASWKGRVTHYILETANPYSTQCFDVTTCIINTDAQMCIQKVVPNPVGTFGRYATTQEST